MYKVHPIERLLQIDGLIKLYNFSRPKGFYFHGESHDFWECEYIYEGQVTITADERVYQLGPGKLLVHRPMEFHRAWSNQDSAPWIMNISFTAHGCLLEKLAGMCFDLQPEQKDAILEIVHCFAQMEACEENSLQYQFYMNLTAAKLEAFLIDVAHGENYDTPSLSPNDERYSRIVQVMKNNCHRNLSLEELAALCRMSVSNMKRVFRQYSDVGIAKYFLTLRMRYAMELLENGIPANQVAEILNFPDTPYFYTVFKRETGMTPAQYRKEKLRK